MKIKKLVDLAVRLVAEWGPGYPVQQGNEVFWFSPDGLRLLGSTSTPTKGRAVTLCEILRNYETRVTK